MARGYDVIVVGLGSMGGSAARELASRGLSVLGLERYWPAHDRGSAHGDSRIIRQSYFEGAAYVRSCNGRTPAGASSRTRAGASC